MAEKPKAVLDERDDATKRLTSHLNAFSIPEEELSVVETNESKPDESELPTDVVKVLELLKGSQALPSKTKTEQAIRHNRINRITAHLHAIQQGPEVPEFTAKTAKRLAGAQNKLARDMQIEALGRQYPVIKELATELAEATANLELLSAEIETLKTPKK